MPLDELLTLLSTTEYLSGQQLCKTLGMTRAAVWKRMEKLREEGYQIVAAGKKGYRLEAPPGALLPGYVARDLTTDWAGRGDILYAREMTSTNTVLKDAAGKGAPKGSLCVCERQTQGKGRLQRQWDAAEGENLLQSLLLCPALPVEQAPLCTLAAAVAMAQAISDTVPGLLPGIKWPNDIVLDRRKCVGILSELSADMDGIQFIVMGVGVNVNQRSFDGELAGRATSLFLEREKLGIHSPIDRRALICRYLSHMEQAVTALEQGGMQGLLPAYEKLSVTLGSRVRVVGGGEEFIGTARAVDDTGALLVEEDQGTLRRVLSGDVSVRGVMGYI